MEATEAGESKRSARPLGSSFCRHRWFGEQRGRSSNNAKADPRHGASFGESALFLGCVRPLHVAQIPQTPFEQRITDLLHGALEGALSALSQQRLDVGAGRIPQVE